MDILINNAGYGLIRPAVELSLSNFRDPLETSVVGPLALAQAVTALMVRQKWGRIVNIGSVSALTATPVAGAYCASKAALHLLSDSLRMEIAPLGIDVMTAQLRAVTSRFGDNASRGVEKFQQNSLYSSIAAAFAERAQISQANASGADVIAQKIASATL